MNGVPDGRSVRLVRWWVRRYTAGLAPEHVGARRCEIDSDLAEHQRSRKLDGWSQQQITRERTARLIRGMPADVGWRHDLLRSQAGSYRQVSIASVTGLASLLLAAFHFALAAYALGNASLANQRFLGGLANYADKVDNGAESTIVAVVIAGLGVVLVIAALARPISPTVANVATVSIAVWAVLFFWLGMWPIGLVAVIGSATDLATRTPNTTPQS